MTQYEKMTETSVERVKKGFRKHCFFFKKRTDFLFRAF